MEELKRAVSAPFKKNLAPSLPVKDFEFSLAFDLKWFSPKTASKVKALALDMGVLSLKDGQLSPGFDVDTVRLPHSFKPAEDFLQRLECLASSCSSEKSSSKLSSTIPESLDFEHILEFVSANTCLNKQTLASEVNSMQDRLSYMVDIRVVALIVARKFGCDTESIFEKVSVEVLGLPDCV